jgi:hypothetical protein
MVTIRVRRFAGLPLALRGRARSVASPFVTSTMNPRANGRRSTRDGHRAPANGGSFRTLVRRVFYTSVLLAAVGLLTCAVIASACVAASARWRVVAQISESQRPGDVREKNGEQPAERRTSKSVEEPGNPPDFETGAADQLKISLRLPQDQRNCRGHFASSSAEHSPDRFPYAIVRDAVADSRFASHRDCARPHPGVRAYHRVVIFVTAHLSVKLWRPGDLRSSGSVGGSSAGKRAREADMVAA